MLAGSLGMVGIGVLLSFAFKAPRKPRRRFKGDRPPPVARIPGKVSPNVVIARLGNLAVIVGVVGVLWVRRFVEQVVIVTDRGSGLAIAKGLTADPLVESPDSQWWIINRSSRALRIEKLLRGSRDAIDVPAGSRQRVDHIDWIGDADRPPDAELDGSRWSIGLVWD